MTYNVFGGTLNPTLLLLLLCLYRSAARSASPAAPCHTWRPGAAQNLRRAVWQFQRNVHRPRTGRLDSRTQLAYRVESFPRGGPTREAVRTALRQAFEAWAALTPLSFREVCTNCSADIAISFLPKKHRGCSPFDQATLAHAFYAPPKMWRRCART